MPISSSQCSLSLHLNAFVDGNQSRADELKQCIPWLNFQSHCAVADPGISGGGGEFGHTPSPFPPPSPALPFPPLFPSCPFSPFPLPSPLPSSSPPPYHPPLFLPIPSLHLLPSPLPLSFPFPSRRSRVRCALPCRVRRGSLVAGLWGFLPREFFFRSIGEF